jgi:hypothetical protein
VEEIRILTRLNLMNMRWTRILMITKLRIENIISKNFLYFVQLPYLINAFHANRQQSDDEDEVYEEVLSEDYIQEEDTKKKISTNSNNNNSKLSQKPDIRNNHHQFNMKSSESEEG